MMRSRAQEMLPMLMPALAALLREVICCEGDGVEGIDGLCVDEGRTAGDRFVAEEVVEDVTDDEVGVILTTFEEIVIEEAATVALWSPFFVSRPGPHFCGSRALSDLRSKVGVFARSSSAEFSSCI